MLFQWSVRVFICELTHFFTETFFFSLFAVPLIICSAVGWSIAVVSWIACVDENKLANPRNVTTFMVLFFLSYFSYANAVYSGLWRNAAVMWGALSTSTQWTFEYSSSREIMVVVYRWGDRKMGGRSGKGGNGAERRWRGKEEGIRDGEGFFQEKEVVIELGKEWKEKDERKNKENGSKTGKK